jgi:hypothetical protein
MVIILNTAVYFLNEMKIDSIYIIHYCNNVDRKVYLDEQLKTVNRPYFFRSLYNRDTPEITEDRYFDISESNRNKRNAVMNNFNKRVEIGPDKYSLKGRAYRAATIEHFKTFEFILQSTNDQWVRILEDDVIFDEPLQKIIDYYEPIIPDNCDICYIGSGCQLSITSTTNTPIIENTQKHSRCSDSYIVKRTALEKIVKTALPFYGAIDWELNYLQMLNDLTVYWATEPKIRQGSQHGFYESSFHIFE